jgi:hypothetical protein
VRWRIGFRARLPLLGPVLRSRMRPALARVLERGLKSYVERAAAGR